MVAPNNCAKTTLLRENAINKGNDISQKSTQNYLVSEKILFWIPSEIRAKPEPVESVLSEKARCRENRLQPIGAAKRRTKDGEERGSSLKLLAVGRRCVVEDFERFRFVCNRVDFSLFDDRDGRCVARSLHQVEY